MKREELTEEICRNLICKALETLPYAYTPYSHFKVAAALLAEDGSIYTGCNIENAAYTPTNCAERTAFFKAVSEGNSCFQAIAIVGGKEGKIEQFCSPCGVCRQVMMEFCSPKEFFIILAVSQEKYRIYSLEELLPLGFSPKDLSDKKIEHVV